MVIIQKLKHYRAGWLDAGLIKWSVLAFALLIVAAGVAGCLWYFGEVQADLDRQRAELRSEAYRLSIREAQVDLRELGVVELYDWALVELDQLGRFQHG